VKLLAYLTETFIATFGITRPRPEQERLANFLIGGFLLTAIVVAFSVVGFMVYSVYSK
jgi:multisubunit Na+/H+ antiporter MnhC subunit